MILEEVKVLMTQYNGITLTVVFLVHKLRGSVMLVSVAELVSPDYKVLGLYSFTLNF